MQTENKQPTDDERVAPGASSKTSWGQAFRVFRLSVRRDAAQRRRALAHEAERDPAGLANWALANDLWMRGDISAAYRLAQEELRAKPTDFQMLLICLDYHIRARDSTQVYAFAERLIAAKNPAHQIRVIHSLLSLFLWPLWLLGFRRARNYNKRVDNLDRWVSWARNYLASHPRPIAAGGAPVAGDPPPAEMSAREIKEAHLQKRTRSVIGIIFLILLIAFLVYWAVLSARRSSRASGGFVARVCPVERSGSHSVPYPSRTELVDARVVTPDCR